MISQSLSAVSMAASSSPDIELTRLRLKMMAKSMYIPKDNQKKPRGEDHHFICDEKQTFGLADGVGGWRKKGIDAGEYARELMDNAFIAVQCNDEPVVNPKTVLYTAYWKTDVEGSSTACVLTLDDHVVHAVNVGDSGFMIIRAGAIIFRSPIQQRRFNRPYQLGTTRDNPDIANVLEVQVLAGDIVVAGTDGLFDNMHGNEFEAALRECDREGKRNPEDVAYHIANIALTNSQNPNADTPFAQNARLAGKRYSGGKVDDITVIVAFIMNSQ